MSQTSMEDLMDQFLNDAKFRNEIRADPEYAIRNRGYQLDEDEWGAVRSIDWNQSDEELHARVSKSMRAATE